jgi:DNA processing protein
LMDARTARIALSCLVEPGESWVTEHVAERGVESALVHAMARPSIPPRGRVEPEALPALLERHAGRGVRVLLPEDSEFPSQLLDLPDPPLALWVSGPLDLRAAALRSVAVVGARACTAYGERATAEIAGGLAQDDWAVISGAAFGIDAVAHLAALAAQGPTVAVLACGIDVAYPRAHESLLARVGDLGAIVTELPPGSAPLRHRFLARNRLIAAMTRGTVVVEAARRSGALSTANRALEVGRVLMAVPGPITSMASSGSNRLLHEGTARAVCCASEVREVLVGRAPGREGVRTSSDALPDSARHILGKLSLRTGVTAEQLAMAAERTPVECLAQLGVLELLGLASCDGSRWRRTGC